MALATCETALRQLMTHGYKQTYGEDWLSRISTPEQRQIWKQRASEEASTRQAKGVVTVPDAGLAYANFYDLVSFADKHWGPLAKALGKQAAVFPLLKRFDNLRNAVGHSRELMVFEQELLSGIAGQIRNQVTIYMSIQDPTGDHYPRIESVTDSFGHRYEGKATVPQLGTALATQVVLHPGDTVTFSCIGIDAQGRELEFTLTPTSGHRALDSSVSRVGQPVTLTWNVQKSDVAQTVWATIDCASIGGEYHRFNPEKHDDRVSFGYRVDPPLP